MKEELMKIGLTENEALVYLQLLKDKASTTTVLAKKVNLHRGYIYDVLDRLIEKGLVSFLKKDGKKHFDAVNPTQILAYIEERKNKILIYEKEFQKMLPKLNSLREYKKSPQNITLLEGKNALKTVFEDILLQKKPVYAYGASGKWPKEMRGYYLLWNKRRVKNKIPLKIIYNKRETAISENLPEETKFVEKRFLDFEKNNPASVVIYSDKIALIIWIENPLITFIESKEVNSLYKKYFDEFWKIAKKA